MSCILYLVSCSFNFGKIIKYLHQLCRTIIIRGSAQFWQQDSSSQQVSKAMGSTLASKSLPAWSSIWQLHAQLVVMDDSMVLPTMFEGSDISNKLFCVVLPDICIIGFMKNFRRILSYIMGRKNILSPTFTYSLSNFVLHNINIIEIQEEFFGDFQLYNRD